MAKRHIVELIDDLDGSSLDESGATYAFALEGNQYEIDLSASNAKKLYEALAPFIRAGRAIDSSSQTSKSTSRQTKRNELRVVRRWARNNGLQVSDRGPVPASVLDAFQRRSLQ